jgi:hypothetical protein
MDFHIHGIDRSWNEDGHWASVEICAPADEFAQIKSSRNAWLCTTPLFEVEGSFENCPIQLHAKCFPSCTTWYEAIRSYGGRLISPGMSTSAYAKLEYERCKVCQNIDGEGNGDCPGH